MGDLVKAAVPTPPYVLLLTREILLIPEPYPGPAEIEFLKLMPTDGVFKCPPSASKAAILAFVFGNQ